MFVIFTIETYKNTKYKLSIGIKTFLLNWRELLKPVTHKFLGCKTSASTYGHNKKLLFYEEWEIP
jgi:hypothetical protein